MKSFNRFLQKHKWAVLGISLLVFVLSGGISGLFGIPIIGMALEKNRLRFSNKGGGTLKLRALTSGGAETTMLDVGYLDESGLNIDPKMVQWDDERGFVINSLSGGEEWKFTVMLQQSGIDEINLAKAVGSYYYLYYLGPTLPNTNIQEVFIPLVKIVNALDLGFKGGTKRLIKLELLALMPKGAVTVTPADFNVAVDTYGIIIESATAKGQITTAAGTIYTAAM